MRVRCPKFCQRLDCQHLPSPQQQLGILMELLLGELSSALEMCSAWVALPLSRDSTGFRAQLVQSLYWKAIHAHSSTSVK